VTNPHIGQKPSRWSPSLPTTVQKPSCLTSDHYVQFCSSLWAALMSLLGINHVMISAYHPQCNGVLERFHCPTGEVFIVKVGNRYETIFVDRLKPHVGGSPRPAALLCRGCPPRPPAAWQFQPPGLHGLLLPDSSSLLASTASCCRKVPASWPPRPPAAGQFQPPGLHGLLLPDSSSLLASTGGGWCNDSNRVCTVYSSKSLV
jgi:transposase InsO family protein